MRAIRYYGPGDIRLDNIPEPVVGPKQVKIKVAWNGICGSDIHSYYAIIPGLSPTATEAHPVTKETLPITMGHEFAGTIVDIGPDVDRTKFDVGQHVAIEPSVTCMEESCLQCTTIGTRNLCSKLAIIGVSGGCGGLAEFAVVDDHLAHVLPPGIPLDMGAMMEPLAVAWHAVKKANVKAGCTALILGAGPVGLMILKILRVNGAGWIGVSGRAQKRCEFALLHGASSTFNIAHSGVDVVAETVRETKGRGVDIVFDCGGSQATIDTALASVRPGGMVMNVAMWKDKPTIDMNLMICKEIVLAQSFVYAGDHEELLQAISQGKFSDLTSLITRRIPLEDLVDKGIMALIHERHEHVKILVHP
ncbi:alcohol dehydrogenase GroES domain protein [Polyporus arcularius HHB13444]|uniref:Alcohol dehydrogenase GroES domain protein n=1 Tax=Polyporus arcularius HHB13444 TaxID=1314778 RepID=A0A5C3P217_9APHY|nr:alcohol dehydrogenase GroES domain protein [Polyporus arcularius HHB13444]